MSPKNRLRVCRTLLGSSLVIAIVLILEPVLPAPLVIVCAPALLLVALLFRVWKKHLAPLLLAKRFGVVIPGRLFRSGQMNGRHLRRQVQRHGITTIIDLTDIPAVTNAAQRAEASLIASQGLRGLRFAMRGNGTGELDAVVAAVVALHRSLVQGEPVLVHCAAGVQRTGHVLSAYLLLVAGIAPVAVYQFAERFGWEPSRSRAWPRQLNERMAILAQALVAQGVIPAMPEVLPLFPLAKPRGLAPWWHRHHRLLAARAEQPNVGTMPVDA